MTVIHVVWYFLMLCNCLVVKTCIISTVGCIAINILSYLILNHENWFSGSTWARSREKR